jgi:hypothetical protein
MSKTAARHFLVSLLSNLYIIRICMRDFFRETSHDCCHMQTSDSTCLSCPNLLSPHRSTSSEPFQTPSIDPFPFSSQPPSSLPSPVTSDAADFQRAFGKIISSAQAPSSSLPPVAALSALSSQAPSQSEPPSAIPF